VSREETDASGGVVPDVAEKKKVSSRHRRVVRWGGVPLPDSSDVVNAALASLLELVTRRPTARAKCLEIALEAATSADEDVRARAIRAVVGKLHPVETLAKAVEAYAEFHLGVAAGAGAAALADARRVAAEASAAMRRAAEKRAAAERAREAEAKRLKAEAEGFAAKPVAATATADDSAPAPADATTELTAFKNPEGKSDDAENDDGVSEASAEAQETLRRVEAAAVASAVAAVSRHILLFCALCNRERALLPKVFRAFATLPEELRPALLDDAGAGVVTTGGFDGLVRLVGPECGPLLDAVRNPPKGSESLAARAIRVLADADAAEAEYLRDAADAGGVVAGDAAKDHVTRASMGQLVSAAETLAARVRAEADARRTIPNDDSNATTNENASNDEESHEDVELLLPLLSAMSAEKVRSLVPRLVALPPELFKQALDRLCVSGSPLTPSELFVALHEVDPATRGVGLKKIIAACGECFERPDTFGAETLASAMSKMVEMHPLPLLFMRTVIQAESAWPTLREFTVNILRSLASKKVWKADAKIWEGFVRCAKRAAPRSFPVLIQMPEAPLLEILKKFPALVEPLRAYANAPAVAQSVPRAVRDALAKA
jgi:symplekin